MNDKDVQTNNTPEWGNTCVKLLQGPLFKTEDEKAFESLTIWRKEINAYFNIIGLKLFFNEENDYAFLLQNEDEEGDVINELPRLLIKRPLTYETSLVLVLLREELDKFEIDENSSDQFILKESEIAQLVEPYYPDTTDKVKFNGLIATQLNILVQMNLIKLLKQNNSFSNDRVFLIRNIIRAKVDAQFLKEFKTRLDKLQQGENE